MALVKKMLKPEYYLHNSKKYITFARSMRIVVTTVYGCGLTYA